METDWASGPSRSKVSTGAHGLPSTDFDLELLGKLGSPNGLSELIARRPEGELGDLLWVTAVCGADEVDKVNGVGHSSAVQMTETLCERGDVAGGAGHGVTEEELLAIGNRLVNTAATSDLCGGDSSFEGGLDAVFL